MFNKVKSDGLAILAIILIVIGVILTLFFGLEFILNINKLSYGPIDPSIWGQFGDVLGGVVGTVFTLAGTLLIYLSFRGQTKQNKREAFESNFFVMINLHRQNVSELNYTKFDNGSSRTALHRKVFRLIFREFIECFREVKGFSNSKNPNDYLKPEYRIKLTEIINSNNKEIDIIELAIVDIAYSIVFYGINKESETILHQRFRRRYNPSYYYPLLQYIKLKPKQGNTVRWDIWLKLRLYSGKELRAIIQEFYEYKRVTKKKTSSKTLSAKTIFLDYAEEFNKYYGGHQHRLGHYFRHLFQCYKYLNYHNDLSEDEKYFYGKTLRAQLSTYEQAIFFVNSISTLGMKWELTPEVELLSEKEDKSNSKLITRFNLIKNLPDYHLTGLKYKKYYPNVKYEADE